MKVSVCIPAYRQPEFVRRALESVRSQTGVSFEAIVTDDSPDDAVQRVVAGCGLSDRVRYVRNPVRLGSPANWNRAVELAEGDYIKFLHHDDYLAGPESLCRYAALLDEHPEADLGFSASEVWMVDSGERWDHRPTPAQLRALRSRPQVLFTENLIGSPSAVIYRRTVAEKFDPRLVWLVDVDFYIRVLSAKRAFAFCPETLVCTTNGSWQITSRVRGDQALEVYEHLVVYDRIRDTAGMGAMKAWARLFARYGIVSVDQIVPHASGIEVPASRLWPALWLGRLVRWSDQGRRWMGAGRGDASGQPGGRG